MIASFLGRVTAHSWSIPGGRLRFALDGTDPEPLPNGHPMFALPNGIITPFVGGDSTAMPPRMARLLRRQIERLLGGKEPFNVVIRSPETGTSYRPRPFTLPLAQQGRMVTRVGPGAITIFPGCIVHI